MLGMIKQSSHFNFFVGLTLIVFGALFLLSNYGIIPTVEWNKIWPIVLILLGATFLVKSYMAANPQQPRMPF